MLVLVKFHYARATPHLHKHTRLFDAMPREHTTVFTAPVVNLLHETIDKETVHRVPVFVPERIIAIAIYEKFTHFIPEIDTVFISKIRYEYGRIGRSPPVILRLVRKKALHRLPAVLAAFFFISLMGNIDKFANDVFV